MTATAIPNRVIRLALLPLMLLASSFAAAQDAPAPSDQPVLTFKALDKITARTTVFEVPVGDSVEYGTLKISVKYCRTRPPEEPPETFAFMVIDDNLRSGEIKRVFSGWMIASSPGWNGMEHTVYDVWVVGCKAPAE